MLSLRRWREQARLKISHRTSNIFEERLEVRNELIQVLSNIRGWDLAWGRFAGEVTGENLSDGRRPGRRGVSAGWALAVHRERKANWDASKGRYGPALSLRECGGEDFALPIRGVSCSLYNNIKDFNLTLLNTFIIWDECCYLLTMGRIFFYISVSITYLLP